MDFQYKVNETPPKEVCTYREHLELGEESIWEETVIVMVLEDYIEIRDPLLEGDILTEVGDPLTEEDTLTEDLLMEMEDHLVEEDSMDLLVDKDHLVLKDHLDQ